jgi:hypothetical protein
MPAVDYRLPGGLSWSELETVIQLAVDSRGAVGIEITIFNPVLDSDGSLAQPPVGCLARALAGTHPRPPQRPGSPHRRQCAARTECPRCSVSLAGALDIELSHAHRDRVDEASAIELSFPHDFFALPMPSGVVLGEVKIAARV